MSKIYTNPPPLKSLELFYGISEHIPLVQKKTPKIQQKR